MDDDGELMWNHNNTKTRTVPIFSSASRCRVSNRAVSTTTMLKRFLTLILNSLFLTLTRFCLLLINQRQHTTKLSCCCCWLLLLHLHLHSGGSYYSYQVSALLYYTLPSASTTTRKSSSTSTFFRNKQSILSSTSRKTFFESTIQRRQRLLTDNNMVLQMSSNTNNDNSSTTRGGDDDDGGRSSSRNAAKHRKKHLPKVIIFDLDGCLWRPEMYELLYFSGGFGAPFTVPPPKSSDDDDDNKDTTNDGSITTLLTCNGEPVYLLGDVADIFRELYTDSVWQQQQQPNDNNNNKVRVGISSRTDQPDWARELLRKFQITTTTTTTNEATNDSNNDNNTMFSLHDVIDDTIIEISSGSKVTHFQNIKETTGVSYEDMIFFDNEYGNCEQVSKTLGVLVGYCPKTGVTKEIWDATLSAFDNFYNNGSGGDGEDGSGSGFGRIIQV